MTNRLLPPAHSLARKITVILAIKVVALFALHEIWFDNSSGWTLPADVADRHVFSESPTSGNKEISHGDR